MSRYPPFYEPGVVVLVTGDKGKGKTNTALVLAEIALRKIPGLEIISNILLEKPFPRYHHFKNESDFLWWLTRVERPMVIFDECGVFASTGAGDHGENWKRRGQLEGFLKLIRKFDINMIWIDQLFSESIPPAVRKLAEYNIDMPWKGAKDIYPVDSNGIRINSGKKRYPNNVLTGIPYYHKSLATFQLNLPKDLTLTHMYEAISSTPPDQFREKLQDWLMLHSVAPPKNAGFPPVTKRESSTVESGETSADVATGKNRFEGITPDEKIPGRVRVWGLLQEHPRIPTKDLEKLTNLSRTAIQKYRNEYNGRIKIQS